MWYDPKFITLDKGDDKGLCLTNKTW
jgi:hypothetical protein